MGVKYAGGLALGLLYLCPGFAAAPPGSRDARLGDVAFRSHGVTLAGSLALPSHGEPRAAVVFIHGSGKQTRNLQWARRFAEAGIAALVYDKRGAGKSGGDYEGEQSVSEKNISLLADDAAAAFDALASRPELRHTPIGFAGISQAGWIAPLAAQRRHAASFLVLWSGPVCKVSEEDIYSIFTKDADVLAAPAPTYQQALASRTALYVWPDFLGVDTDSAEILKSLSIPGLWIFGDHDGSIPVDLSLERLTALRRAGHHYDYVLSSGLGHNNMDATFRVAADWIRQLATKPATDGATRSATRQ